ncbi:MAG: NAD-dependent epimerase/dehydratase family protein, partial [Thermohalobaculum sp.]|nr:NAD-dependent epimerase/dehydratase family protein [Thermohalobaculum sp.]
ARRYPQVAVPGPAVEVVAGDLADAAALERLVQGAQAVIHLAGAVKARDAAGFMAANADGTARLAQAWQRRAPQAHMVLVSSLAARAPELSPYATSKRAGETRLAGIAGAGGGYTILRPAAVYGPGDRETLAVFRAARLPVQPVPGGPQARVCLIHAADVAAAVAAIAGAVPAGATHELSDARRAGYAWSEIAAEAARALGRRPHPVRVPAIVLALVARAGDAAAALGGQAVMLSSAKLGEVLHSDWSSSPQAQPPAATWHPAIALPEGFRETVAWYREHEWL